MRLREVVIGLAVLMCAAVSFGGRASDRRAFRPSAEAMALLDTLRPEHPRVLLTPQSLETLRSLVRSDHGAREIHRGLVRRGQAMLSKPTLKRKLAGPRLLQVSRTCLKRVSTLALLYVLDGKEKWANRALKEMKAVAAFKDWNPSHFLDVAEMTCALALGYDWLYDFLSEEDRETIKEALVEKGLLPAAECFKSRHWWTRSPFNWNLVCNGGTVAGALAVADEEKELAAWLLDRARKSVPIVMASYAPDGGWAEGPGYWGYATKYCVILLASLDTALGHDFGLSDLPGLSHTAFFPPAMLGPTGKMFNYADSGDSPGWTYQVFWLAKKFNEPYFAKAGRSISRGSAALQLLWYVPEAAMPRWETPIPDQLFRGVNVASFRSAWDDKKAVFVAFKGGDNKAGHSHLDLGTFVLDASGVRWALELAGDNYNLPGYFGSKRWEYYRLATCGQNTLTINGKNQGPRAESPIVAFSSPLAKSKGRRRRARGLMGIANAAFAVADLSQAYKGQAGSVLRGVALLNRHDVLIQDELVLNEPAEVIWAMHTKAEVEIDGPSALLRQNGKELLVRLLVPRKDAGFELLPAKGKGSPNKGVKKLVVKLQAAGPTAIVVLFTPLPSQGTTPKKFEPLNAWIAKGLLPPLNTAGR